VVVKKKNWFTAMGILFIVVASIAVLRDLAIWGPDFMVDFLPLKKLQAKKYQLVCLELEGF
jgi:hypothetical protein